MTLLLSSAIFGPAFLDPAIAGLLDDAAYFRALLEVEVALARVQARLGIIPDSAASAIASAAAGLELDAAALGLGVLRDGIPMIALVKQLRVATGGEAAQYVHWGATSQDIMDSATVLCARRALAHLERTLGGVFDALARLAVAHRSSVMAARTHGQQALPTTFGLKVALWASPLLRQHERLRQLWPRFAVVQLGGAAGTLAALGPRAPEVVSGLALELGLGVPELPWHAQRDRIVELGAWLGLLTGSLGKLAQDVILLCQSEVAELAEALPGQRGGSSSMPQKNNPMRSEQILAVARMSGAQLAALQHALVQEHERGTHGWQVEWLCLAPLLQLSAGALHHASVLLTELQVDPGRMRANLLASPAAAFAEAAVGALSAELTRPEAQALVARAATRAHGEGRQLVELLREQLAQSAPQNRIDWAWLAQPENHLGQALAWVDQTARALHTASAEIAARSGHRSEP
jgi:3-carboxy-cis,cis-muconate cycloisomerase